MKRQGSTPAVFRQQGFSLIELMIASVIGLLLLSAVLAVFVSSSRTYRLQESMSRVQESGRFVLEMMSADIRVAGFGLDNGQPAVLGYADARSARAEGQARVLAGDRVPGEVLYIPSHLAGVNDPATQFGGDITYFVGKEGNSQLSLYKRATPSDKKEASDPAANPAPQALVDGVEGLVFEYGVDDDGNRQVDRFVAVNDVADADWSKVLAVRLNVLVTGIDVGVVDEAQGSLPEPFNTVSTADRRLYQVYKSTVAIRNRLP